jgi:hypothetical protein
MHNTGKYIVNISPPCFGGGGGGDGRRHSHIVAIKDLGNYYYYRFKNDKNLKIFSKLLKSQNWEKKTKSKSPKM